MSKDKDKVKNAGISLKPEEIKRIHEAASQRGLTKSGFIRLIMSWFFGDVEEKVPDPPKEKQD